MEPISILVTRREVLDDDGNILDPGGIDEMQLHHWGVHPISMRDSDGAWRFHQQSVAFCSDKFGKIHMVDPEFITIIK